MPHLAWMLAFGLASSGWGAAVSAVAAPALRPAETSLPKELLDQGWYARADSVGSAALDSLTARPDADPLAVAGLADVIVEAIVRDLRAAREPRALALAESAVSLREGNLGHDDPGVAPSLSLLANVRMARGDYPGAIADAERAVRLSERGSPDDSLTFARSLYVLGLVRFNAGETAPAESLLRCALSIQTRLLPAEDPVVAETMGILGVVEWERGRMTESDSLLQAAILASRRSLGDDHPQTGIRLAHLGVERMIAGRFTDADSLHRLALAIFERRFPSDHPLIGSELFRIGNTLAWSNRLEEALPYQERALPIMERGLGPDAEYVANVCSSLGDLYSSLGDPTRARPILERALSIREHVFGREHPDVALSLDRLGEFLMGNGDEEHAAPLLERALRVRRDVLPMGHVDLAWSLERLGRCYAALDGSYRRAGPLFEEAIPIFIAQGPDHPATARGYALRADLLLEAEQYRSALAWNEKSLAIYERSYGEASEAVAWGRYVDACAYWGLGEWDRAREQFRIAAVDIARAHPSNDLGRTLSEVGLGIVLMAEGRASEAFETVMHGFGAESRFLRTHARLQSETDALRLATGRTTALHLALTLASESLRDSADTARRAFDALVRERAVVLDEMATRHHIYSARDPGVDSLVQRFVDASRATSNLRIRVVASPVPSEPLRIRLEESERERNQVERQLAERSAAFRREQTAGRCGLEEVATALAPGTALVSYVRFDRARPSRAAPGRAGGSLACWGWSFGPSLAPEPAYLAFVLRGGERTPTLVPLGDAHAIDALVTAWRREAGTVVSDRPVEASRAEQAYRRAAERLRLAVWDPIATALSGAREVFIVPDGPLDLVNFATLPVGVGAYLIEQGPLTHYLSTERDLVVAPVGDDPSEGLLAVGDPDFDARPDAAWFAQADPSLPGPRVYRGATSSCEEFRTARFAALPGAEAEVREIAALWPAGEVVELTGPSATETAFKTLAPGHEIVHVATHGFILGGACPAALAADGPAGVARGIGGTMPAGGVKAGSRASGAPRNRKVAAPGAGAGGAGSEQPASAGRRENPLLLYGLAFAGANRRDEVAGDRDDGILTAEEIAAMDLSGVRWAVLSACESGVGEVRAGEGVLGLRRAFQVAGARTTIMSLWWVDDQATRRWMRACYEARVTGKRSTPECVRDAALDVLREHRTRGAGGHPFTWGAFVAAGDWR